MPLSGDEKPFDAIVIGTGFGGAVTACRLAEAGFRICVLERGRVYEEHDFPKYPTDDLFATDRRDDVIPPAPDFSRWLWHWDRGIYDVRDLGDAVSVQAAGYGGGSLIYANVHLRPPREVFDAWPVEYRGHALDKYFDLAAYMLNVSTVPQRLLKSLQLQRAAGVLSDDPSTPHWFLTPLAVNFEERFDNVLGETRAACDMRGRCCIGCDRQAKNTLDLNYLAMAEKADADIRTLAEVTKITRKSPGGFVVSYKDLLAGSEDAGVRKLTRTVEGNWVFLCAGALNTTELLMRNPDLLDDEKVGDKQDKAPKQPKLTPLGSHYFPNTDSLAAVLECDEPHEADYGPTVTAAVLHRSTATGDFSCSMDFSGGSCDKGRAAPVAGLIVRCDKTGVTAKLAHDPILDWGGWDSDDAVGTLVFSEKVDFSPCDQLEIGPHAKVTVRSAVRDHTHWFLAQDGGYPPDLEPLVGIFRSPLWLRRNRFVETDAKLKGPLPPPTRNARRNLRLAALTDALGGTGSRGGSGDGLLNRSFSGNPLSENANVSLLFPDWFRTAAREQGDALLAQASAFALPMLGRLLDDLSTTLAKTVDADVLTRFDVGLDPNDERKDVLIRGMLRQGLQILAGSEAQLAEQVAKQLLNPVPNSPGQFLGLLSDLLLWLLAYKVDHGHTGIVLTMGRDLYRGRLYLDKHRDADDDKKDQKGGYNRKDKDDAKKGDLRSDEFELKARLPNRLVDTSGSVQERVLREIAGAGWNGELRTNPASAALGRRLTVHSQGGCPMGADSSNSVTDSTGKVHGSEGLYVMDAAAFPASVGVNPSATILAVAESKIERFIHQYKPRIPGWQPAKDKPEVAQWASTRQSMLDPLNGGKVTPADKTFDDKILGLSFNEHMSGLFKAVQDPGLVDGLEQETDPEKFGEVLKAFRVAEDRGTLIRVELNARIRDLARLVSADETVTLTRIPVSGTVEIGPAGASSKGKLRDPQGNNNDSSFLQMFVRPQNTDGPLRRFFIYRLVWDETDAHGMERRWQLDGRKVLRDDLGQDLWQDTATLYFEASTDDGPPGDRHRRGILRLSFNDFLLTQLKSMDVCGTKDPTRKMWALLAFYRYFAREISCVYASRAREIMKAFASVMTEINV